MAYSLPNLPYSYDALEPHLDTKTMEIHHSKHHQTYINNINTAIEGTAWADLTIEDLVAQVNRVPDYLKSAVINQGGGHANHSLFWTIMSPQGGGKPFGQISLAIEQELGGFEQFKDAFTKAAISRFGSGWAWLSVTPNQKLIVESSANQDSPLMHGHIPILALDVWEHAYYLKFQNRRPEYISSFYHVIHWEEVNRRYLHAIKNQKTV